MRDSANDRAPDVVTLIRATSLRSVICSSGTQQKDGKSWNGAGEPFESAKETLGLNDADAKI
jgi:hypothetical protein